MKSIITICLIFIFGFMFSGCSINSNNSNNAEQNNISNNSDNISKALDFNNDNDNNKKQEYKETEISNFSTPLKSGVANRITNIKITSDKINELTLKNSETFSFNEIIGPCTAEEGYKEAEIYVNEKIEYALGGGNCQVSTTLYNAALAVERNCYSRKT